MCTSPRNLTWFTRPFLLVRGWDLGTRLSVCLHVHTPCFNGLTTVLFQVLPKIVNSQNCQLPKCQLSKMSTPKILYCNKMHCIFKLHHNLQCWNVTYQTAPQTGSFDPYQVYILYVGQWDGVVQDLEEMDVLDDGSYYSW